MAKWRPSIGGAAVLLVSLVGEFFKVCILIIKKKEEDCADYFHPTRNFVSTRETIERYQRHTKDNHAENPPDEQNMQQLKHETASMMKKIEFLEISKRRLLGEGLGSCSIQELQQLEQQLERSVGIIRARKMQVFRQQVEDLNEKVKSPKKIESPCGS
ncbi:MADS-box protein SOC1-like [Olea europaea var. sylvestris]|uniref:MADS-box protein SOC1-like n=1 Tax=Olea europaea var. sylvestris TaxID=158386 RepID=UPI000C1D17ED|nr:MADS-box protein SOC1-like [Olea europaea var. sylvestris]